MPLYVFIAICTAFLSTACASFKELPTPKRVLNFRHRADRVDYQNGLKALVLPDQSTNLVKVDIRYRTGASDDPLQKAGLAHLAEHLVFHLPMPQGGSIGDALHQHSLDYNAYTSWDETHFMFTGFAHNLENLLRVAAAPKASACNSLDEEVFLREREVVRNEIRQRNEFIDATLFRQLHHLIYPEGHLYDREIGGDDIQLASFQLADVCNFLAQHYVLANASLVISGNVSSKRTIQLVDRYFAKLIKSPHPPQKTVQPVQFQQNQFQLLAPVDHASVAWLFPLPPQFDEDYLAIELFRNILDLQLGLSYHTDFILDIDQAILGGNKAPVLAVYATVQSHEHIDKAKKLLWEAIYSAVTNADLNEIHIHHARQRLSSTILQHVENLRYRTIVLADYLDAPKGYGYYDHDILRISQISRTQLYQTAQKFFTKNRAATVYILPDPHAKQRIDAQALYHYNPNPHENQHKIPTLSASDAETPLVLHRERHKETDIRHFTLKNGMQVLLAPKTSMPTVELQLLFRTGMQDSPSDQPSLARLAARLLATNIVPTGKGSFPSQYNLFLTGASLHSRVDQETTIFKLSGLAPYQDTLISGFASYVVQGLITSDDVHRLRNNFRKQQANRPFERRRHALARFWKAIYGPEYSVVTSLAEVNKEIQVLRSSTIRSFKRQHYRADNAVLMITGQFNPTIAEAHIRRWFEQSSLTLALEHWHRPTQKQQTSLQPADNHVSKSARYFASVEQDRTQIEIALAYPLGNDHSPKAHATRLVFLEMLQTELADLREVLGATYGMHARLMDEGQVTEVLLIQGTIDRQRISEALHAIRSNLQHLQTSDHFARNFALARRTVAHQLLATPSDSHALAEQLTYIVRHQLPMDYFSQLTDHVASLSPNEVQALAQAALSSELETMLCMGSRNAIEEAYQTWKVADIQWINH